MEYTLCIDAGQSGCRLRLVDGTGACGEMRAPGLPLGVPPGEALARVLSSPVRSLLARVGDATVPTVAAGVTGLHGRPPGVARFLLEAWGPRHGTCLVTVADDSVTGYLGALGARPGAVIAAGTGAVALATDATTRCARADGLGQILGDGGSGFWIGRQGLVEAFRYADGRGGSVALLDRASRRYRDLAGLPALLTASPDRGNLVASFAKDVADAASSGDATAARIWREAGSLLAETTVAALRRAGLEETPVTVSWTGALFSAGELLRTPFTEAVRAAVPRAELRAPRGTPLDGAELLARLGRPAGFGDLVDTSAPGVAA